jgi:hypothetical protein
MSVHGVGAAAAHRPQFTQTAQRGSRPVAPQPSTEGAGGTTVGPTSGHNPPAHGVRRLMAEGHFDGKNSYGPLVAKFGVPPEPSADPTDQVAPLEGSEELAMIEPVPADGLAIDASGSALDVTAPPAEPNAGTDLGIDDILLDEPAPDQPASSEPSLLDIDTLLMEELVNEQTVIEEIVEQLDDATEGRTGPGDTTEVAV